jgi:hypothetical protein
MRDEAMRAMITWRRIAGLGNLLVLAPALTAESTPLALWLCDERPGFHAEIVLQDSAEERHPIALACSAEMTAGKFGQALRPRKRLATPAEQAAARNTHETSTRATTRGIGTLNVGASDWTIEGWLHLDASAREEGVIFEAGIGAEKPTPVVTRFSVLPGENAFALTTVRPAAAGADGLDLKRVEVAATDGPVGAHVALQTVTFELGPFPLPRSGWFHVALAHRAADGVTVLFIDGRRRAGAVVAMAPLPEAGTMYAMIGCDARGGRLLAGCLDELRICTGLVYTADFRPPGSFGPPKLREIHE